LTIYTFVTYTKSILNKIKIKLQPPFARLSLKRQQQTVDNKKMLLNTAQNLCVTVAVYVHVTDYVCVYVYG